MRRTRLAGLLVLTLSGTLVAQFHRKGASTPAGISPRFDYYVLSLSWAPEFCAQPGAAAESRRECASGQDIGFVVHGLWPELNAGEGPESCGTAKTVPKPVVNFILPYMPSPGLIQHEWATHGTCTGLSPANYFTSVLQARAAVQTPVQITSIGKTTQESPGQIEAQFTDSNPSFAGGAFRALCRAGALTEVRVCFDKELKPRVCADSAGKCAESFIMIRPPR